MSGKSAVSIPWSAVVVLVAAAGGAFLWQASMNSSRPPAPQGRPPESLVDYNVDARLWQDPFSAVYAAQDRSKAERASVGSTAASGKKPLALSSLWRRESSTPSATPPDALTG